MKARKTEYVPDLARQNICMNKYMQSMTSMCYEP